MSKKLALYCHIPFCASKCSYCDFHSSPGQAGLKDRLVLALLKEGSLKGLGKVHQPTTLYIGGGTPTNLSLAQMDRLLTGLKGMIDLSELEEWTVEANPRGLTQEMVELLTDYGVNRISLGVQSFHPQSLEILGRSQNEEDVRRAVRFIREANIPELNLDLIYALPGQRLEDWQEDLHKALTFTPDHLSLYQLGVSPGTPLERWLSQGKLPAIDEEFGADAWEWHTHLLKDSGFIHYEISNYAKPGFESLHNQSYWRLDNYLALGPSASEWLRPFRRTNEPDLLAYLRHLEEGQLPPAEEELISMKDQQIENMIMTLRMQEGLRISDYRRRYGKEPEDDFGPALEKLKAGGLLLEEQDHLRLTERGQALGNEVFMCFV